MKNNEYGESSKIPDWIERGHSQDVTIKPFLQPLREEMQIPRSIPQPVPQPRKITKPT